MSDRLPATTIGELDIHLWNVMQKIDEVQRTLGTLATKSYVDDQVRMIHDRIQESKPSTLFANLVKVLAGLLVVVAFFGMVYEVSATLSVVRQSLPASKP